MLLYGVAQLWRCVLRLALRQMCGVEHRLSMVSNLPRDALLDHLIGLGGMPAELRDQAQLVDYFLPAIRSDYT